MKRPSQHRARSVSAKLGASLMSVLLAALPAFSQPRDREHDGERHETKTPIKHLIVLIGENRTFDHVFATYEPKHGQDVGNLLSKGIVNADGSPGLNAAVATQDSVNTPFPSDSKYFISVDSGDKTAYSPLPTP